MLSGSELWLLRLMADRGLALLDASTLLIVLEEGGELHMAASSGSGSPRARVLPVEGSALGGVYRAQEPVFLERPRGKDAAWLQELGLDARAALIEPLAIEPHGRGMIIALRTESSFRAPDRQAVAAFAQSLAARLSAERTAQQERLRYGIQMREHERTRWARELHDDTVQGLGALRLQLANARDSGDSEALRRAVVDTLVGLEREIVGIRHLITELRPAALDDFGLVAALEALARRAHDLHGLEVQTDIDLGPDGDERRLDPELESTIYRVVQEALTNVSRHAHATRALVSVAELDGSLEVAVTDNGRGLGGQREATGAAAASPHGESPAGPGGARRLQLAPADHSASVHSAGPSARPAPAGEQAPGGFGLPGMRERADLVGGQIEMHSAPGEGTTVRLTIPRPGATNGRRGGLRAT